MLDVVTEHAIALGSTPSVRFGGPLDTLPDDFVDDLISVLHATLSALAEGRGDRLIDIAVTSADRITLEITDTDTGTHDPQAPPGDSARDTTAADSVMRERATARGGTLTRTPRDRGNTLCWTVPTP